MADSRIPSLPVELLINVASNLVRGADLCSLTLVNIPCNYAATLILYADIALDNPSVTRQILDTLNRPSMLCSFQRDLPSFIRSFVIDWGVWYADDNSSDKVHPDDFIITDESDLQAEVYMPTPKGVPRNGLRAALENAVLRMYNLRRFSCWESFMFTPKTFACLVAGPAAQTLQELGVTMEDWRLPPYRFSSDSARPTCPHLRKVHFILPCRQLDWDNSIGYVGHLLKTSALHLESLALDLSSFHTDLQAPKLFSTMSNFRNLEVLRLPAVTDLSSIYPAPNLQCLQLNCDYWRVGYGGARGMRSLPSSHYPRLEQLYCSHIDLPAFLPADTDTRRPIRGVFLDEASYDLEGGTAGRSRVPLYSGDLEKSLRCLRNSAVPVTELNIYLERVDVLKLREVLPYIRHLKQFIIVTGQRPKRVSGLPSSPVSPKFRLTSYSCVIADVAEESASTWQDDVRAYAAPPHVPPLYHCTSTQPVVMLAERVRLLLLRAAGDLSPGVRQTCTVASARHAHDWIGVGQAGERHLGYCRGLGVLIKRPSVRFQSGCLGSVSILALFQ